MEVTIPLATRDEALALFGLGDRNLKSLRDGLGVKIAARNDVVRIQGEKAPLEAASEILGEMLLSYRSGVRLPEDFVEQELSRRGLGSRDNGGGSEGPGAGAEGGAEAEVAEEPEAGGRAASRGAEALAAPERALVRSLARSPGQQKYLEALLSHELVFSVGPAGTGKTFLAVNVAVHFLRQGDIRRLVLCRPAVEAGEKLGFLPGDFQAKINPYLRPLYDSLNDVLGYEQVQRYLEREIIEIVPLAFMRGRTLNNAFIILDEGQNTTVAQMKMFLTRMGAHSRIVVNGDVTQVDLPPGQGSGLIHAQRILRGVKGIAWNRLSRADIVRHPLVQRIVDAYEVDAVREGAEPKQD